ncbi:putative enoyl-(acyl-carrier-protein) reductase II [Desulfosporosinus orientis DSM 765]|uniref:Probable nitronate monooxygenase n=1 Tax=Desulfosporosinus orientis (strain ATCC 19365 / DSM 765 / NCIMB 8382 / VKM B-1628 / Singapore I) TaxID=768706 RepID=G7WG14_DESOD|nr:enoyl-[acyl-carrier-protein] reductase FabK [Desulfosporosinus orientis]AET70108.1 putative enoyl-(acyl-carrier-protein) reductase II [Desulfosporosinus orientis DSM 765]
MIKTRLCELIGIEYPIFQGGMAWVSTGELVAAVSEGGSLGIIGSGQAPADWLRQEIHKVKAITQKPFGVNVMLMSPFVEEVMQVILEERVPVITTGAGNPGKYVPMLKEVGTKVIPVVASVALAKRLEKVGVDALIAEGMESGGHVGEIGTLPLVPQVVDAVNIPVIAAGGIVDGRGLVAALALGAEGVQMGTRFMCAEECTIAQLVKDKILKAKDRSTVVTGRSTGHPVRCLENPFTREMDQHEREGMPAEELEKLGVGKLRLAMVEGDVENGSIMSGQVAGAVRRIEPAAQIIQDVMQSAEQEYERLSARFREGRA